MSYKAINVNPKRFNKSQLKFYIFLIPLAIFMMLPIVYIFSTAFKPMNELFAFPPRLMVQNPTTDNFKELFELTLVGKVPLNRYVFNSLFVTLSVVGLSVVFSSMAGFALSKLEFKGKTVLFEVNQLALMFVGVTIAIPKYLVIQKLGILNTMWVHILPMLAIPVGLFLLKQFIDQVPNEIIEAAKVDAATDFEIYWYIILPIIKPAIATIAILAFQSIWNDSSTSQLYIDDGSLTTLAFYMTTLSATTNSIAGQGIAAAASLIMFVPNLIIFICMQSMVMNTVAHAGLK